uniref:FIIND domain-containing protein n=1 Tax=Hucho hucho TaxID=62062 RepID=A0A4W5M2N2_9TELE
MASQMCGIHLTSCRKYWRSRKRRLDSITQLQMWKVALHSGLQSDCDNLLRLCESEIHLSVQEQEVWKSAGEVLKQKRPEHINLCLHASQGTQHITTSSMKIIFDCLSNIADIRFISLNDQKTHSWNEEVKSFQVDLYIQGALYEMTTGQTCVEGLLPVLAHLIHSDSIEEQSKFMVSLYSKAHDTQEGVLPVLQPVFQTTPAVWYIDLSEKGTSGILEVLKFQNVKKPVELWWSDEESERELTIFLQCLPYISELRFNDCIPNTNDAIKVLVDLFICAATLEGETLKMLSSVCGYSAFPFADRDIAGQCAFLLDLYSHVSDYETQTGRSILPALLPLYQTAPALWSIDLSEKKASLLLEVLKLQPEKKPVELRGWSDDESEVRSFLQCLPYISYLRFFYRQDEGELPEEWRITFPPWLCCFLLKVFLQGAVNDTLTGQRSVEALLSALGLAHSYDSTEKCMLLLDLYSHAKDYEIQTGRSILPALQPVYLSTPSVWSIDLSERKASLLLEVLKLQPEKKQVELRDCSDDESDVRSFLQCLPYISYLSCDCQFFLSLCDALSVGSEGDALLSHSLLQALHYTLTLSGWLPSGSCKAVGAVLGQSTADEELDVTLTPQSISLQGAKLLFEQVKELHKLRMNEMATVKLARMSLLCKRPMIVKELTLVLSRPNPTERVQCRVISSLASLLTVWTIRSLDLTDCPIEGYLLTTLLCHQGPLTIRLSEEILQQLAVVVYEAQDEELTQCFLEKVEGDLSNCRLDWDVLHYLLKSTTQPITINLRRSRIRQQDMPHLLPFLNNIHFERMNSHFQRTALKEIHKQRAGHMVTTLVRSSDEWINLNNLVLKHDDCEALRFALHYSDGVKVNLLWTVIPKEEMGRILTLLHRVSELRVDRKLLLELLHAWTGLKTQSEAPAALLRVLNHKLDLSCSSAMDLSGQEEDTVLSLSSWDCRAISAAIDKADGDTELILHDCQVEDAGLEEFYKESILQRVHLSLGKPILLQLLHLIFVGDGGRSERLASLLSRALGKELDLSQTPLDLMACSSLALILEHSEGLSELDLSDCHLTDTHLAFLLTYLHKAQVLNLCNNEITDEGAVKLNQCMIGNSFTETVWLCNNKITKFDSFLADRRYKLWPAHVSGMQDQHVANLGSASVREETSKVFSKTKPIIKEFDPEIVEEVEESKISYRFQCWFRGKFQCRATGLVFGMREPGTVEYSVDHWDMHMLADTDCEPACPVFKISCPEGHMYQLHLLHCETEVYTAEALSVAHICSNSLEILEPNRVTHSHVIININGLSRWTSFHRKPKAQKRINGQVLLFLELNITEGQHRIWVYLLPRNVPYTEEKDLHIHNGPDQHATFTVLLDSKVTKLNLMIQELKSMGQKKVWKRQWFEPIFLKPGVNLTESDWLHNLCRILENLSAKEIKRLKFLVRNSKELPEPSISNNDLECLEELHELAELMVKSWGMNGSISATQFLMGELPRKDETVTSLLMPFLEQCVVLKGA